MAVRSDLDRIVMRLAFSPANCQCVELVCFADCRTRLKKKSPAPAQFSASWWMPFNVLEEAAKPKTLVLNRSNSSQGEQKVENVVSESKNWNKKCSFLEVLLLFSNCTEMVIESITLTLKDKHDVQLDNAFAALSQGNFDSWAELVKCRGGVICALKHANRGQHFGFHSSDFYFLCLFQTAPYLMGPWERGASKPSCSSREFARSSNCQTCRNCELCLPLSASTTLRLPRRWLRPWKFLSPSSLRWTGRSFWPSPMHW
jgi:hypothetical protein